MEFINLPILLFSIVLVVSILTSLVSSKANVPLILIFLFFGMFLSDTGGLGIVSGFHQPKIAFFIGSVALALILFNSGYQTNIQSVRKVLKPSVLLATFGVFFTALFLAPAAHYIIDLSWFDSFLLASIISSTDAAAVFFVLRMGGVSIRNKIKSTLEMESGSNDPMAIFLTLSVLLFYTTHAQNFLFFGVQFIAQAGIGLIGAFVLALFIKFIINKISVDSALYPVLVIGLALGGFSLINLLGGSGYLALYISGILVNYFKLKGRHQTERFQRTLTWLSQIVLFLTLGFFADISQMPSMFLSALVLSLVLLLFARPLAVFLCLSPFQYSWREKCFISFVGLRGATSILLALAPLVAGIPAANTIFSLIFLMVLMSLAMQGLLIIPMAKRFRVILPVVERPAEKTEIDLPELSDAYLISYRLTENSPVVQGAKVPRWARPIYTKRENIAYNGINIKSFKPDDLVYVFATDESSARVLDSFYGGGQTEYATENMGDFVLKSDILLKELAHLYNVSVPKKWEEMTLQEALEVNFSDLDIGDRFLLGKIEFVIRKKENQSVSEVGLNLEPDRGMRAFARLIRLRKKIKSKK